MNDPMPAIRSILGMPEGSSELAGVDHAYEAGRHITWAHQQQDDQGEYDHSVGDNAALAIAEATLALAAQQRIANLIAYASHRIDHTDATGGRDVAPALRDFLGELDFRIREGLRP